MEFRKLLKTINRDKKLVYSYAIAGAIAGVLIYLLPTKYYATGTLYAARETQAEQRNFFLYEGYYGQQAALSYANTIAAIIESKDIAKISLNKLGINPDTKNLRNLGRKIHVKKPGPQIVTLTVKGNSPDEVKNYWSTIIQSVIDVSQEINANGDERLNVSVLSEEPIILESYRNIYIFTASGVFLGSIMSSFYLVLRKYLKK